MLCVKVNVTKTVCSCEQAKLLFGADCRHPAAPSVSPGQLNTSDEKETKEAASTRHKWRCDSLRPCPISAATFQMKPTNVTLLFVRICTNYDFDSSSSVCWRCSVRISEIKCQKRKAHPGICRQTSSTSLCCSLKGVSQNSSVFRTLFFFFMFVLLLQHRLQKLLQGRCCTNRHQMHCAKTSDVLSAASDLGHGSSDVFCLSVCDDRLRSFSRTNRGQQGGVCRYNLECTKKKWRISPGPKLFSSVQARRFGRLFLSSWLRFRSLTLRCFKFTVETTTHT